MLAASFDFQDMSFAHEHRLVVLQIVYNSLLSSFDQPRSTIETRERADLRRRAWNEPSVSARCSRDGATAVERTEPGGAPDDDS